ncbi:hypothetical protein L1856_05925 [Streptomyces sp. Tue 6430]|nr:hypothetical protein [Streptomyces sp. Tue 6430]
MDDSAVRALMGQVLKARKGDGYGAALIAECSGLADLPASIASFLLQIDRDLRPTAQTGTAPHVPGADNDVIDEA